MNVRMRSKCRSEPSLEKISFLVCLVSCSQGSIAAATLLENPWYRQNQNKAGAMIPLITVLFSGIEVGRDEVTHASIKLWSGFYFCKTRNNIFWFFSTFIAEKFTFGNWPSLLVVFRSNVVCYVGGSNQFSTCQLTLQQMRRWRGESISLDTTPSHPKQMTKWWAVCKMKMDNDL